MANFPEVIFECVITITGTVYFNSWSRSVNQVLKEQENNIERSIFVLQQMLGRRLVKISAI